MSEHLVPISLFVAIAACLIGLLYYQQKIKSKQQQTIQKFLEVGKDVSPEIIESIGKKAPSPYADITRAILLIAFSIAIVVYAALAIDDFLEVAGLAVFPLFIGLAFLLLHLVKSKTKGEE